MKKRWKDVEPGERIRTKSGSKWEVTSNEKAGKGLRRVSLKGDGGVFPKTVEADQKIEVEEAPIERQVRRHGMEPERTKSRPGVDFSKLLRESEKPERSSDPWQVDPLDTVTAKVEGRKNVARGGGGPWDKPADKAEKVVSKTLGAELVGVQPSPGSPYASPPVDPSTIKGHLFLMHDTEAKSLSWEELVEVHDRDHQKADADPHYHLPVPHHHTKERPA